MRQTQAPQLPNRYIATIGQLREAIALLPDDRLILAQVVDEAGGAWIMMPEFHGTLPGAVFALIQLSHPSLKKLPTVEP